jgi:hypothetical protein
MLRLLLLLSMIPATSRAQVHPEPASQIEALIAEAEARELHLEPGWLKLIHYRETLVGWKSDADGTDFFLADRGRLDPQAELEATLRGFARLPTEDELRGNVERVNDEGTLPPLQHPVCRFPARLYWLSTQLELKPEHLAVQSCPKFSEYLTLMEPTGASLVFSSYHLENPASTFGHTLIRIHRRSDASGTARPALIDHGVNFGAVVGDEKGLRYIVKGLIGLYPGRYSRIGYYLKVREYNDHDSRDLWTYPLQLSPDQVWLLVAHLWELDNTWFSYFFRTENCSYQMLSLLEAVHPELDLLPHRLGAVVPIETIQDAQAVDGLVGEPSVSMALRRQFETRVAPLNRQARRAVVGLQEDAAYPLSESSSLESHAAILDAAVDLIEIHHPDEILLDEASPEAAHRQLLLSRRAELGVPSPPLVFSPSSVIDPTQGHGRMRLSLEGGMDLQGSPYGRLQFRAALHDWADPSEGYPELEQIEFLPTTVRMDPVAQEVFLEELTVFRTRSLQPLSLFHRNLSNSLEGGVIQAESRGCTTCLGGRIQTGSGVAIGTPRQALVGYVMGQSSLWGIPLLPGIRGTPLHLGVGGTTGLRLRITTRATALLEGELMYYPWQDPVRSWVAEGSLRWGLGPHMALGVHARAGALRSDAGLQIFSYW